MAMDMVLAVQADGFRGYVTPILSTGFPRFGLTSVDFGTVIRNPQDTADLFNIFAVTELGGNAVGSYTFLVPASFFVTHGVGNYLLRIFLNTYKVGGSGAPNIIATAPAILRVTQRDIDQVFNTAQSTPFAV